MHTAHRRCVRLVLVLAVAGLSGLASVAVATADTAIDVDAQCQFQYPADDVFQAGAAYVVAPGDAFSWRCQRARLGGGGVLSGLGVDVGAFCSRTGAGNPVILNKSDPFSWRCR